MERIKDGSRRIHNFSYYFYLSSESPPSSTDYDDDDDYLLLLLIIVYLFIYLSPVTNQSFWFRKWKIPEIYEMDNF